jgi:hypothetical protein
MSFVPGIGAVQTRAFHRSHRSNDMGGSLDRIAMISGRSRCALGAHLAGLRPPVLSHVGIPSYGDVTTVWFAILIIS